MLKRIILLFTTFTLVFAFVTYQPKKVDAYAGVAAKVVAQQAIKAVTKTAVDSTVQRMLVKELLEEVTESYAKKQGYKLIESGGQRMYMKATYNETEKVLLKKQIDKVIDKEVYGNTPKFIKFLDWFVGVGAVIAVGQVLYATLTGEFQSYMSDIITQAMIDLGWLTPAQKVPSGTTVDNPVRFPTDVPEYNYTPTERPALNFGRTAVINESFMRVKTFEPQVYRLPLEQASFQAGSVFYVESMPTSSSGMPYAPYLLAGSYSSSSLGSNVVNTNNGYMGTFTVYGTGRLQMFYGLKPVVDESISTLKNIDGKTVFGSDFDFRLYNRFIVQNQKYYPEIRSTVSRFIVQDTYLKQMPDVHIQITEPNKIPASGSFTNAYFNMAYYYSPGQYPTKLKFGIFSDIEPALDTPMLPVPKLDVADLKVPIVTTENRVPIPNVSILPDGYIYDPTEQVIKDPTGQTVTDPESIQLPTPDPVITETPEGEVEIDGTPTGVPVPPGGTSPPTNGGGTGDGMTTGDPTNIEWDKLKAIPNIFTKKFPFSLPWDAKRFIDSVLGDIPEAKDIVVNLEEIGGVHIGMNITLPDFFDQFFDFTRVITLVIFDIGLIYGLYRLLGGAS